MTIASFMPKLKPLPARKTAQAPLWIAAACWLLAGLSASYWALSWWGQTAAVAVPQLAPERHAVDSQAVARALGAGGAAPDAAPAVASRHQLLGVVRDAQGHGVALIASDGQAPKPYRVGAALPDGQLLRGLDAREALIGPAQGASERLSLPPRP